MIELYRAESPLQSYHPLLRPHFVHLITSGTTSLLPIKVTDIIPFRHLFNSHGSYYAYHFILNIPYASKVLQWEIIFNPDNLNECPDFSFPDDFHLVHNPLAIRECIPTLKTWNVHDPTSLEKLLQEFVMMRKHQYMDTLMKENHYSVISAQMQPLFDENIMLKSARDMELWVSDTVVLLMIKLNLDLHFFEMFQPQAKQNDNEGLLNPGIDVSLLKVSFLRLDGSKIHCNLYLSPQVEQVLQIQKNVPKMKKQVPLQEYIITVRDFIQNEVNRTQDLHQIKRELVFTLIATYSNSLQECDYENFTKIVLLLTVEEFTCSVQILLEPGFPDVKPQITLSSIYCTPTPNKKVCFRKLQDCPYSPRWSAEEVVNRINMNLLEEIPKFQTHSH